MAKTTRKQAIEAKCRDCIYDPLEPGNWRQQVHNCRVPACPLFPVRPKSSQPLELNPHDDEAWGG